MPRYLSLGILSAIVAVVASLLTARPGEADNPLPVTEIKRDSPVDFEKEILPILRQNCLACHNHTDAESELVLETPQLMLKGGSAGAALIAGNANESLAFKVSAHQVDPVMPPKDNKVSAKALTPEQLGLFKLWIDQGGKGDVTGGSKSIQWQPLPPGVNPIYAVAVSPDGQYVAAGRANQIFVYHLSSKQEIGRLTDPSLNDGGSAGIAHRDLVQSLRFSPDGELLASGGFRAVKVWQRPRNFHRTDFEKLDASVTSITTNANGTLAIIGDVNGKIGMHELPSWKRLRNLEGHEGSVASLAISVDQTKLVSGGQDRTLRFWNLVDGQALSKIDSPVPVQAVTFVSDGSQVASGGSDHSIRIWSTANGSIVRELSGHTGSVSSLAVLPSAVTQIISGSQDGTMRLWNTVDGNQLRQFDQGGPVNSVAVRADGQRFASAGANQATKLWDAAGKQLAELKGDFRSKVLVDDTVRSVAIAKREIDATKGELKSTTDRKAAEEKNAASTEEAHKNAAADHVAKSESTKKPMADKVVGDQQLVDFQAMLAKQETEKKTADEHLLAADQAIQSTQAELVSAEALIAQSGEAAKTVAGFIEDGLVRAREAAKTQTDNKALAAMVMAAETALKSATDGQRSAAEAAKSVVVNRLVEVQAQKKSIEDLKKTMETAFAKTQADIKAASENLTKLVAALKQATDAEATALQAMQSAERAVQRAKDSVQLATTAIGPIEMTITAAEEFAKRLEEKLAQVKATAAESEKAHTAVAFAVNGKSLVTVDESQIVRTWDSEMGLALETYQGHSAKVTALACVVSGDVLSGALDGNAILWKGQPEWKLARTLGSEDGPSPLVDRVTALDFSPDGRFLATGGGEPSRTGELKFWNVGDGALVREIKDPHSDVIYGIEFSPNGVQIASSAADRTAKIFDVATGKFIRTFEGHSHHVLGVSWRADGRVLATSGADNVIKIWDVRSGEQKRTIAGFSKEVTALRFLADGSQLIAACGDQSVQVKNSDDGANVRGLSGAADFMHSVAASANGKRIASGGQDSVLRIWDDSGAVLVTFDPPKGAKPP